MPLRIPYDDLSRDPETVIEETLVRIGRDPAHAKIRVSLEGNRVTKAWEGDSDYVDIGLWKFSEAMVKRLTGRKEVEYRVMPNLQDAIADGESIGYLIEEEWLHLGGTEPTPEINTLRIAQRVRQLEGMDVNL